jgi:hypothetical protein
LYLERIPFFQILCIVVGCCRQFANDGKEKTGGNLKAFFSGTDKSGG